jgi:hypothetical protein
VWVVCDSMEAHRVRGGNAGGHMPCDPPCPAACLAPLPCRLPRPAHPHTVRPRPPCTPLARFVEHQFQLKTNREAAPGARFLQALSDDAEEVLEFAGAVVRTDTAEDAARQLQFALARLLQALVYQCR